MSLCGFNAYQVKNGSCERGAKLRKTPMPEVRGAICVDTLANQIVEITPRRIEHFFNRCIEQLAQAHVFPKGRWNGTLMKIVTFHFAILVFERL